MDKDQSQRDWVYSLKEMSTLKPKPEDSMQGNAKTFYNKEGGFLLIGLRVSMELNIDKVIDGLEALAVELINLEEHNMNKKIYDDPRMN